MGGVDNEMWDFHQLWGSWVRPSIISKVGHPYRVQLIAVLKKNKKGEACNNLNWTKASAICACRLGWNWSFQYQYNALRWVASSCNWLLEENKLPVTYCGCEICLEGNMFHVRLKQQQSLVPGSIGPIVTPNTTDIGIPQWKPLLMIILIIWHYWITNEPTIYGGLSPIHALQWVRPSAQKTLRVSQMARHVSGHKPPYSGFSYGDRCSYDHRNHSQMKLFQNNKYAEVGILKE